MELKNIPPSMFVESKIFGNFKFDSPPGPLFMWSYLFIPLDMPSINRSKTYLFTVLFPGLWVELVKINKESDITRRLAWV